MINKNICFECDSKKNIQQHHVVPKSKGGKKKIPLCGKCHGKVHNKKTMNTSYLTKLGLKKAKKRGVILGNPQNLTNKHRLKGTKTIIAMAMKGGNYKQMKFIVKFREKYGMIFQEICNKLNDKNHRTTTGKKFIVGTVIRLYKRAKELKVEY